MTYETPPKIYQRRSLEGSLDKLTVHQWCLLRTSSRTGRSTIMPFYEFDSMSDKSLANLVTGRLVGELRQSMKWYSEDPSQIKGDSECAMDTYDKKIEIWIDGMHERSSSACRPRPSSLPARCSLRGGEPQRKGHLQHLIHSTTLPVERL
jgi:hypothetical protein